MTDRPLLARYADAADPEAMAELVRRHGPMVLSAARRLAPADADDVAQAVFVLLACRCAALRHRESVAGWLYEATRLCAKDARRAAARRRRHLRQLQEASMPSAPSAHAGPEWADELDHALAALSDPDRHVVLLRFLEGLSVAEAAERLGLTPAAVTKRAGRALDRLREIFRARGHAVPAEQIVTGLALHAAPLSAGELARLSQPTTGGGAVAPADHANRSLMLSKAKAASVIAATVLVPVAAAAIIALAVRPTAPPPGPPVAVPAALATLVTAAPQSFEAAEQTVDVFLTAVRDNDLATARVCLPVDTRPEAAAATVAALRQPYAAYPGRLTERVGTSKNQDMNGRPLELRTETSTPIDASVERVTLRLTPRPDGGGWVVVESGITDGNSSPPQAANDDVPRIAPAEKATAQQALKAWNTWFEPAKSFSSKSPTKADVPKILETLRHLHAGLGPMLDALKGTPFEKPADTRTRAAAAIDLMIDVLNKQDVEALNRIAEPGRFKDSELVFDLWNLGPRIAERADAEASGSTASARPTAVLPDRPIRIGDKTTAIPGPQPVPDWLRGSAAWKRWQQTRDIRTFTTRDDAGNRYVVNVNGFTKAKADGPAVEGIGAVRRYRPDGTLAAVSEYNFGGDLAEWRTLDATGKRATCRVRLENRNATGDPEVIDSVWWYEPDGSGRRVDFDSHGRPREVLVDPIGREQATITPRYLKR